jgi:hypothetical protein
VVLALPIRAVEDGAYFQLRTGDEWTYEYTITSKTGEVTHPYITRQKVEEKVLQDGKTYFRIRFTSEGFLKVADYVALFRRADQGLYSRKEADSDGPEQSVVVFPLKIGNSWLRNATAASETTRIIGIENVSIQDHIYQECYHFRVETKEGKTVEEFWEAPNMGTIKSIDTLPDGSALTLILREFHRAN